jgi:hypothetical protein
VSGRLLLLFVALRVLSGCAKDERSDPKKMFDKVQAVYAACSSFQCDVEIATQGFRGDGEPLPMLRTKSHCEIRFRRPEHVRVLCVDVTPNGPGTTNVVYESEGKVFVSSAGNPQEYPLNFALMIPSPFSVSTAHWIPRLLLGTNYFHNTFIPVEKGKDIVVNGTACYTLRGHRPNAEWWTELAIAKDTFLIHRITESRTSDQVTAALLKSAQQHPGMSNQMAEIQERLAGMPTLRTDEAVTLSAITVNPLLNDAAFTFQAAPAQ